MFGSFCHYSLLLLLILNNVKELVEIFVSVLVLPFLFHSCLGLLLLLLVLLDTLANLVEVGAVFLNHLDDAVLVRGSRFWLLFDGLF